MKLRLAIALAVCGLAAIGTAQTAYSNLGSGDSFGTTGWTNGLSGSTVYEEAMGFVSLTSGSVSGVDVALFSGSYLYHVTISADNGGTVGGTLESWDGVVGHGTDSTPGLSHNMGDGSASLIAGQTYWVTVGPGTGQTGSGAWNWNSTGDSNGLMQYSTDGETTWTTYTGTRSAFRVTTSTVPEPASMAALGIGAVALAARRRRK